MTEPQLKRFFLHFDPKANVYILIDRQTGQAGGRFADYTAALRALDVANQDDENERAYWEALARASGRPQ